MEQVMSIDFSEKVCGYVMPISSSTGYRDSHWSEIKSVLDQVTNAIGFKESRIVSTGLDVSTIHKRIVNNIYNDDIIICDVSSRNPNVMFELGMRIAFDKPVVIIKDNDTQYCFDSGTIEHLEYPKDLRYADIEKFKVELKSKIEKTLENNINNPDSSPILHSFGSFSVAKPNIPEMSESDEFRSELGEMKEMMYRIMRRQESLIRTNQDEQDSQIRTRFIRDRIPKHLLGESDQEIIEKISHLPGIRIEDIDSEFVMVRAESRSALRQLHSIIP